MKFHSLLSTKTKSTLYMNITEDQANLLKRCQIFSLNCIYSIALQLFGISTNNVSLITLKRVSSFQSTSGQFPYAHQNDNFKNILCFGDIRYIHKTRNFNKRTRSLHIGKNGICASVLLGWNDIQLML